MLSAGFHDINAGGVDTAVAEQVRQFGNVMLKTVKGARKQVPEVVWINLAGRNTSFLAQSFHVAPDIAPVKGFSGSADKHRAGLNAGFSNISNKQFLKRCRDKNDPCFIFAVYHCFAAADCFHRNIV